MLCSFCYAAILVSAYVNPQAQEPEFEVVSVSYLGPYDTTRASSMRGGPGTSDPTRISAVSILLLPLLNRAYGVGFDQIVGPSSLDTGQYTVIANVPVGTVKEQLALMWRHLLEQRFHLVVHHETRDLPRYELVVAKGGPRMRQSSGEVDPTRQTGERPTRGSDGFPVLPAGARHAYFMSLEDGVQITREVFRDFSMSELVKELALPLGQSSWTHVISTGRIVDKTALNGKYDFRLEYTGVHFPGGAFPQPGPDGQPFAIPTLLDAIQQQLGLRIETVKAPTDVLVVDHIDKVPTAN